MTHVVGKPGRISHFLTWDAKLYLHPNRRVIVVAGYCSNSTSMGGAENVGVENAGVENAGGITYGKPSEQKTFKIPGV